MKGILFSVLFLNFDKFHAGFKEELLNQPIFIGGSISASLVLHQFKQIDILLGELEVHAGGLIR